MPAERQRRAFYATAEQSPSEVVWIDPNELQPGPIRRESLPAELVTRIKAVRRVFQEVDSTSLEKWLDGFKRDVNRATDDMFTGCRRASRHSHSRTGNVAFDDWREKELERLAEERRKLDEARGEFDEYMRELRLAKDQKEFDKFMARRNKGRTVVIDPE